jgi:hypothetical protein
MSMKNWTGGLVTAAGILLLTACTDGVITGEGDEAAPEKQAPPPTASGVIIPHTTKVLTPEAQAALVTYDPEVGTLVFDRSSAGVPSPNARHVADPAVLQAGDVVVSGIAKAAPYGLLRRITDVIETPDRIEVLTMEAVLGEAIEQGKIEMPLSWDDGQVHVPLEGWDVKVTPDRSRDEWGLGGTWTFGAPANHDLFTGGRCIAQQLGGSITVNAKLVINVEGATVKQFGVFAEAGANMNVNIQCNHTDALPPTPFTFGQYISPAYQFYIGDVPLVLVYGTAAVGSVSAGESNTLKLTANWAENYKAGLGYTSGSGWGPQYEHTSTPLTWDAKGNGSMRVNAGVVFALSIYSGYVFEFFDWVEIGVLAGITGATYALPFLEVVGVQDYETGSGSATLYGGLESGGAVGTFLAIDVSVLGWQIFSQAWSWVRDEVFPEIKNTLASITY